MSGYWKFNASLLDEKDFQDQLELMLRQELRGTFLEKVGWLKLRIELDLLLPTILAAQRTLKV